MRGGWPAAGTRRCDALAQRHERIDAHGVPRGQVERVRGRAPARAYDLRDAIATLR